MPVDAAAVLAGGPADVERHRRHGFGVRLVVADRCVTRAAPVADRPLRPVTVTARLEGGPHVGNARNRPRIVVGDDVEQLTDAGGLVMDERFAAFTDMALDAGDVRMRGVLPGRVLRVHRLVAHRPQNCGDSIHLQRAVAGDQDDDDVDGGQRWRW